MQNENIIKCPNCGSDKIKKREGENDFLHVKPEGEPARKQKNCINKNTYYCLECGYKWDRNKIEKTLFKTIIKRSKRTN